MSLLVIWLPPGALNSVFRRWQHLSFCCSVCSYASEREIELWRERQRGKRRKGRGDEAMKKCQGGCEEVWDGWRYILCIDRKISKAGTEKKEGNKGREEKGNDGRGKMQKGREIGKGKNWEDGNKTKWSKEKRRWGGREKEIRLKERKRSDKDHLSRSVADFTFLCCVD